MEYSFLSRAAYIQIDRRTVVGCRNFSKNALFCSGYPKRIFTVKSQNIFYGHYTFSIIDKVKPILITLISIVDQRYFLRH